MREGGPWIRPWANYERTFHMTDKIKELEVALSDAERQVHEMLKAGKIPVPADYADVDRIKRDLKTARRIASMAMRSEPKLTRKISVLLSDNEFNELSEKANNKGMILSKYIRQLLKYGLKVEDGA